MSRQFGRGRGRGRGLRRPADQAGTGSPGEVELELVEEGELDIPIEELREFLSADFFDVPADPAFREGLREKLWELIQSGSFGYGRHRRSRDD